MIAGIRCAELLVKIVELSDIGHVVNPVHSLPNQCAVAHRTDATTLKK
jgi:hypothetical protein